MQQGGRTANLGDKSARRVEILEFRQIQVDRRNLQWKKVHGKEVPMRANMTKNRVRRRGEIPTLIKVPFTNDMLQALESDSDCEALGGGCHRTEGSLQNRGKNHQAAESMQIGLETSRCRAAILRGR